MGMYRKKPVVIEALQFDGTLQSAEEISRHFGPTKVSPQFDAPGEFMGKLMCHTLEGPLFAVAQDWIISGVQKEVYPCKADIFAMTYEPAASPAKRAAIGGVTLCPDCDEVMVKVTREDEEGNWSRGWECCDCQPTPKEIAEIRAEAARLTSKKGK